MADSELGKIEVPVGVETDDVEKGVDEVNSLITNLVKTIKQMGASLRGMFDNLVPKRPVKVEAPEIEEPEQDQEAREEQLVASAAAAREEAAALRDAQKTADNLTIALNRMNAASEQGFRNYGQVLRFSSSIEQAEVDIAAATTQLKELAAIKIPTTEYQKLTAEIEKTDARIEQLVANRYEMRETGVDEQIEEYEALGVQLEIARKHLQDLVAEQAEMEANKTAFVDETQTEQYRNLEAAIEQAQNRLETNKALIDQQAISQARLNVTTAQEAVAAAQTTREREKAMQQLTATQNQLAYVAGQNVTPAPDPDSVTSWEAFRAKIKDIGKTMISALGTGASKAFSALRAGLKKAVGWLKNLRQHASSTRGGMNGLARTLTSMKTMLTSRLKRTFLNQIVNTAKESIGALAQFDSSIDRSISNMKNGLKGVGANLAVSLGNIIQTIEPIITKALDAVSLALTRLNALLAALRGAKTVTVAKKQTDSYAASLSGAAGSASKAAAAQKKLNTALTNYDELHKLDDNTDTGAQDEKNDGTDLYKEVPVKDILAEIPGGVTEMLEQVKDAVRRGDWRTVGGLIADGLDGIVAKLDGFILRIKTKAVAAAKALADGINGFTDNFNFDQSGQTIGHGIGLIISTLNSFISGTNWAGLGAGLARGINGIFNAIDWAEVGQTVAAGFNGLFDFIYSAITTADWPGYGAALGDAVSNFITTTDWGKAGATLGEAVKGLLGLITGFIENTDWWAVGEAIWDAIAGIDWSGVADAFFEGIGAAITGAVMLLGGLAGKIMTAIKDAIVKKAADLGWDLEGANIIEGLLGGIIAALVGIGDWIIDHIFKPIWNGIKKAFGISSPAKEMKPLGGYIIKGLLNGIVSGVGAILDFFAGLVGKIWDAITSAVGSLIDAGAEIINSIWRGVQTAWAGFAGFFSGLWNGIWDGIKAVFSGVTDFFSGVFRDAVNAIHNIFSGVAGFFSEVFGGAVNTIKTVWGTVGEFFGGIWDSVKEIFGTVAEFFGGIFTGAADAVRTAWNAVGEFFSGIWEGIKVVFSTVVDFFSGIFDSAAEAVKTVWNTIIGFYSGIWDGIKEIFSAVADFFKGVFNDALEGVKSIWNTITGFFEGIWAGIQRVFRNAASWFSSKFQAAEYAVERVWNAIKGFFSDVWEWIKSPFVTAATWFYDKFTDVVAAIKAPFDGLIGWFQDLWQDIKDVFSFNDVSGEIQRFVDDSTARASSGGSVNVPHLAAGGVLKRGQVGLLEGDGTEAVVPLENNKKWITATAASLKSALRAEGLLGDGSTHAVTRGLDSIAEKIGAIADRFSGVQVAIPAPATGAVIPPRARVSEQTVETTSKERNGLEQKLSALIELLTEQQSRDNTISVTVPVELDQRQIGNAVTRFTLANGRMTNGSGRGGFR